MFITVTMFLTDHLMVMQMDVKILNVQKGSVAGIIYKSKKKNL